MKKKPAILPRLIAFELLISGTVTVVVAVVQGYETLVMASLLFILVGGLCLWITASPMFAGKFEAVVSSRVGRFASFVPVILLVAFLFFFKPGREVTLSISPLLLSMWAVGLQLIWAGNQGTGEATRTETLRGNKLSLLALLFACGFLMIPSRVPSILNGIQLDRPVEFVVVALILPIAWIINKQFFSNKMRVAILLILLVAKLAAFFSLPQSGMGVRVYTSPQEISNAQPTPGYITWLNPSYSDSMQSPYKSMREFPVEWVNNHFGFDFDQFWMTLEIDGTIRIYDEGRFVFVIRGEKQALFEITDVNTNAKRIAIFVDDFEALDPSLYQQLPQYNAFDLRGTVLYTKFGEARLEPVLLYPDGATKSLFENAGVWLLQTDVPSETQSVLFENLLNFFALVFIALISFGMTQGIANLYHRGELSMADIYLSASAPGIYYLSSLLEKPQVPLFLATTLMVVAMVKLIDFKSRPSQPNLKAYVIFAGTIFLLGYLTLDINSLRSVAILPKGQDGLEYQTFARNIFVNGDIFLKQTPPRAYKVLFPYMVGLLHTIFGQSLAAQFFLNAWCAVLSAALTFTLARKFHLSLSGALLTSISFIIILCMPSSYIYYFRFGLMEPVAVLILLATMIFAVENRLLEMRVSAIIAALLRLDYLGLIIATIVLTSSPLVGDMKFVWSKLLKWMGQNIKDIILHVLVITVIPALVIASYHIFVENYMLNASDTTQLSIWSMLEGFIRVLIGGNLRDLREMIVQNSFWFLLITIPLAIGFVVSFLSIFYRRGIFAKIDLRLAILIPSILPVYIAVQPTGYFSRFSFPILALDLILIGMFLSQYGNREIPKSSGKAL